MNGRATTVLASAASPGRAGEPASGGAQHAFARALLGPEQPCPPGLTCWNGSDPARRYAVYRNNVTVSLVDALAETFAVTRQLVGEPFFRAMARLYVVESPPKGAVLNSYGDTLPDFIAGFEPARALPYLPDVARLEVLRVRAFHAADLNALSAAEITPRLADPETLPQARLRLHPSLALLDSRYAVVSIWAAHQGVLDIGRVDPMQPECALVLRPEFDVLVIGVEPGSAELIRRLLAGDTLGAASSAAAACDSRFDLAGTFGLLIQHRALCAWS